MKKAQIIEAIKDLRKVNTGLAEDHAKTALTWEGDHNIYTEMRDWHEGKVSAYDQILELLEAA